MQGGYFKEGERARLGLLLGRYEVEIVVELDYGVERFGWTFGVIIMVDPWRNWTMAVTSHDKADLVKVLLGLKMPSRPAIVGSFL